MNPVTLVFGVLLINAGFVTLVRRLHDRSMHESIALWQAPAGGITLAVTALVGLLVPIVSSIAAGTAFVALAVMGRSLAPFAWFG